VGGFFILLAVPDGFAMTAAMVDYCWARGGSDQWLFARENYYSEGNKIP
jgi:hypothetical protein